MPVMKICPKCGGENAPGFGYCGKCGAPLNDVPAVNLADSQTTPPISRPVPTRIAPNGTAMAIKTIAILVYLVGVIASVAVPSHFSRYGSFSVGLMLICLAFTFFVGTMLMGFSEIIRLLNEINQKTK